MRHIVSNGRDVIVNLVFTVCATKIFEIVLFIVKK